MIQCHQLPSCKSVSADHHKYIANVLTLDSTLSQVVFYEKKGMLESGMLGTTYNLQISQTDLPNKPNLNDVIKINGQAYKFLSVRLMNNNPAFFPFYQCEVKSVTNV